MLSNAPIRYGFCLALAAIAAAIADPIVEFASNAGWFGHGSFTDHSNLDVVPSLLAGVGLMVIFLARRARAVLAGQAFPRGIAPLFPTIFALQILTLFVMETGEQVIAWGHVLGPAVWLGGPLPASLAIHAAICIALTFWISRSVRVLAATTLRVIRLLRAIATLAVRPSPAGSLRFLYVGCFKQRSPVLCQIGERAPPIAAA
jgi:hypothetical protein